MLNQNNKLTNRSQQLFSLFQLTLPKTNFTKKEINSAIISVRSLSKKNKAVLNEELNFTNYYINPNPSHSKISIQAGCVRRTAIRAEKQIERAGLLKYIRSHRKTNIIIANPIIFDFRFRVQLQKELPALANKRMLKLCFDIRFVTPIKEKNSYIKEVIVRESILQSESQRKEKSQRKILKKKGNEVNLDSECKKILESLHLTAEQYNRLFEFPETTIAVALKKLNKRSNKDVRLLFFLCNNMTLQEIERFKRYEKKQSPRSNTINEKNNFDSISVENNHRLKKEHPISSDNVYSVPKKSRLTREQKIERQKRETLEYLKEELPKRIMRKNIHESELAKNDLSFSRREVNTYMLQDAKESIIDMEKRIKTLEQELQIKEPSKIETVVYGKNANDIICDLSNKFKIIS